MSQKQNQKDQENQIPESKRNKRNSEKIAISTFYCKKKTTFFSNLFFRGDAKKEINKEVSLFYSI